MRIEEIEGRLQVLEVSMQAILHRLNKIEDHLSPSQIAHEIPIEAVSPFPNLQQPSAFDNSQEISTGPPPIIFVQDSKPLDESTSWQPLPNIPDHKWQRPSDGQDANSPPPSSSTSFGRITIPDSPTAEDTEYKIGINGLLRGGAAVVLVAILFAVATLVRRGLITPPVQFAGEIVACLVFIAIGIRNHSEREDFGQLMVGIGSFGLYASVAGGYAFKHLYEGEPLVAMFMVLSFANLGYAMWRSSKTFLAIGMLGGLVAAMMPMQRDKVMLDFALHFLILLPSAAIVIRNKWNHMAGLMFGISSLALVPSAISGLNPHLVVGAIYANCAVTLFASAKTFKSSEFDEHGVVQTAILILTAFFAISNNLRHGESLHIIVLAAISAGIGYGVKGNVKARNSTWFGGLIVLALFTPISFDQSVATICYSLEALALILLAIRYQLVALWTASFSTILFSLVAYVVLPSKTSVVFAQFSAPIELLLLGVYSATVIYHARFALQKGTKEVQEIALFAAGSLLVAFFVRGLNIMLGNGNSSLRGEDICSLGIGLASLMMTLFAVANKRIGLLLVSGILTFGASALALITDPSWPPHWMSPTLIFLASGSVLVGTRYLVASQENPNQDSVIVLGSLALSAFFIRLLHLAGINHLLDLTKETVTYFAFGLLSIIWLGIYLRIRRTSYLIMAWIAWILSAVTGASLPTSTLPTWLSPVLLLIPISCLGVLYVVTPRKEHEEAPVTALMIVPGWVLSTILLRNLLLDPLIGMQAVASYTVSWVIFAVFLIVIGFTFDRRYLRYWALAVFGITVGKVFLVDLSELDSVIRVSMLALLGLGMMGGGWWYILWRRKQQSK